MVEFALLLPMLLVLFLGIADFARVFEAGIITEAAARDAAEAVALERLREKPPLDTDPDFLPYYERLHALAARTACAEAAVLPNTTYTADDPSTTTVDEEACPNMPVIAACVRDGQDPICGTPVPGYTGTTPDQCSEITRPWSNASGGEASSHSVEVRMCYRFTTIVNLTFSLPLGWGLSLGDVYLQRARVFVVDCPPGPVSTC